ncbi:MAG: hypothetical protein WA183_07290 [Chthoniobacterales bacterium]
METINPPSPRIGWPLFALLSVSVVGCHAIYFFLVYRARVLTQSAFASSDFFLIYLPLFIIFAAFTWLWHARGMSRMLSVVLAFPLTFLSFWLSLFIPFNMYGM